MANARSFEPLFNGRFMIEIEGIAAATFVACDGLEARIDVIRYNNSTDSLADERKRPGRAHYSNILLRRGLTTNDELWNWFNATLEGRLVRKNGSIVLLSDDGSSELMRYNFSDGWPCRWKSVQLDSNTPGTLVEELEIAVEKIKRA